MSNTPSPSQTMGCPTTMQLRDWLEGNLELSEPTIAHLASCQRCAQSLAKLSDDANLQILAGITYAKPSKLYSKEPEFEKLRQSLSALSFDSPLTPVESTSPEPGSTERRDGEQTDSKLLDQDVPSIESLQRRLPAGRFVVDRFLAQGGSGAVYLAYDQKLQREVAIKVLARDSLRERQRFQREARVLAELQHANIVRVFDFGTLTNDVDTPIDAIQSAQSGQLYLIMEYVSGGTVSMLSYGVASPIWQPTNESISSAIPAKRSDPFRQLARLLATAADGLAAAHAKSLVHRDVKPGNLLLTADRTAIKVADFGLARLSTSDATQVTRTGDLLGTPVFMSPEQAAGNESISALSDVYSLGATLYQLLTDNPPFQGNSAAVLRLIGEATPVAPRLWNPKVPLDLEVICLHAMEKAPSDRYSSMQEFAEDLKRFASGEPIRAKPISAMTKAVRFLNKNRSFAIALLACVLLLLSLTCVSVGAALVFRSQNGKLLQSAQAEKAAKVAAQDSLRKSIEAADQLLISVTEDTELLPRAPGSEQVARKLLLKAQEYYKQVIASGAGGSIVVFDAARARSGLAQVALRLGNPDDVDLEAEATMALLQSLPDDAISGKDRTALAAKTLGILGKALANRGELSRAIEVMNDAVQRCESELPNHADSRELKYLLADSLRGRAVAENMAGQLAEAEASIVQAQSIFNELLALEPNDPNYLRTAAACESTFAVTLVRRDGYSAAKQHLEQANAMLSRLSQDGQLPVRLRTDRATNIVNLASVEFSLGNMDKARELFTEAELEYQQLSTLEPDVVDHKYKTIVTILNSGKVDVAQRTTASILEKYRSLEPKLNELLAIDPHSQEYLGTLGMVQGNTAVLLRMLGRSEEALESLKTSDSTLKRYAELIENTPDSLHAIAFNQYELSKCYLTLNRIDEALQAIESSMVMTSSILKDHSDYLASRMHQVDERIAKYDLLQAAKPVDSAKLLSTAEEAFVLSTNLLSNPGELLEYEIAHGIIFSCLSEAHLLQGNLEKSIEFAEKGIAHLMALVVPSENERFREVLLYNTLAAATACVAKISSFDNETEVRNGLVERAREMLMKSKELGASEEELAAIEVQLK